MTSPNSPDRNPPINSRIETGPLRRANELVALVSQYAIYPFDDSGPYDTRGARYSYFGKHLDIQHRTPIQYPNVPEIRIRRTYFPYEVSCSDGLERRVSATRTLTYDPVSLLRMHTPPNSKISPFHDPEYAEEVLVNIHRERINGQSSLQRSGELVHAETSSLVEFRRPGHRAFSEEIISKLSKAAQIARNEALVNTPNQSHHRTARYYGIEEHERLRQRLRTLVPDQAMPLEDDLFRLY